MIRSLALLLGLAALAQVDAAGVPVQNEIYKIVYFGDDRPLLIELDARLDGRPVGAVYQDFLKKLFTYLDRDKDGVLSKAEMTSAPSPQALAGPNAFFGFRVTAQTKQATARAGKTTPEGLAAHYRRGGLKPFGLSFAPKDTGVIDLSAPRGRTSSPEAINARLFELLDADKDGKLSRKELASAPAALGGLDSDEDEVLTTAELQGQGGLRPSESGGLFVFTEPTMQGSSNQPFHLVEETGDDGALARHLLQRYGKKGDKGLSAKQLGLDDQAFASLDRDGDGTLDSNELARFGRRPGEARFTVRLGKRQDKEPVVSVDKASAGVTAKPKGDGVELTMGKVRIELVGPSRAGDGINVNFNVKDQYVTQFRMADTDNNMYLDKAEGEKSPFFRATFAAMDRDGDGMLYEKEMLAYYDGVEELRQLAGKSCLTVTVMDEGKGLFEMFDRDGDGRLSVRELRRAVQLLEKLDADQDGQLARTEVPRRYKGTFDKGSSAGGRSGATAVVLRSGMERSAAPEPVKKGPVWFRKMDRNRDGDVSRKEWLGSEDEFKAADADGDGLIGLEEAERYDKAKRQRTN